MFLLYFQPILFGLPDQRKHNRQFDWQDLLNQSKVVSPPIHGQTDIQLETQREYQDCLTAMCHFITKMRYLCVYRD